MENSFSLFPPDPFQLPPSVGDLTNDGRDDLVFSGLAFDIFQGQEDGSLRATTYSTINLPPGDIRSYTIQLEPLQAHRLLVAEGTTLSEAGGEPFLQLPDDAELLNLIHGDFVDDDNESCVELVLAYEGSSSLWLTSVCDVDGQLEQRGGEELQELRLTDDGSIYERVFTGDYNGDGHLDLIADVDMESLSDCTECTLLQVAYGVGDGTFHSDPAVPTDEAGDGRMSSLPAEDFEAPAILEVRDLNNDSIVDVITSDAIFTSHPEANASRLLDRDNYVRVAFNTFGY